MAKFSVKKPLTIFVLVIAVLVLGVVSYLKMTPDLFPNMDFPYIMIMTTYPGASPEKVEAEVTKPMEQSMATLEHIKEITSTSGDSYSMLMLEFEESVNLDTIGVDIQQNITSLSAGWDEMVSSPYVLKINPSMLPVEVAAVSMEGMSTVELTEFLNETLMNKLEGVSGVARISTTGAIVQELHVILDQDKIDTLNEEIAAAINEKMDEAADEIAQKKEELEKAQTQLEDAKDQLNGGKQTLANQTAQGEAELSQQQANLLSTKAQLQDQIAQLQAGKTQVQSTLQILKALQSGMAELEEQANGIKADLDVLLNLQETAKALEQLRQQFEDQMDEIRNNGDLSQEEIDAAIEEIKTSPEYIETEAAWAKFQAQLAAYGLDLDKIQQEIELDRAALEDLQKRLEQLEQSMGEQGLDAESLNAQITEMENSQATIAPYYAGDILMMMENNEDLDYAMPADGANLFYDAMCIPTCSKNKEDAEKFINFMQSPEIAAANFEYLYYATPNQVAYDEHLDEEIKNNEFIFPSDEYLDKCYTFSNVPNDVYSYMQESFVKIQAD